MNLKIKLIYIFSFIFLSGCIKLIGQDKNDSTKIISLNEVVVSVNKIPESIKNITQEVKSIDSSKISKSMSHNVADLLAGVGIHVQKSQLGGGSPVLRGFEASRIVLMIDGVRMNNLIYRAGHLQDIIKTDIESLEKVEVLFGPSSTVYGSDALGGVINMFTKTPKLSSNSKISRKTSVALKYETADEGMMAHVENNLGFDRFASYTSFTYNKYGDLKGGKTKNPFYEEDYGLRKYYAVYKGQGLDSLIKNEDPYLQVGSSYNQYDIIQKFLFIQNNKFSHSLNLQFSNSSDIPRYDRLTDPSSTTGLKSSEWYYGPQTRMLISYDLNYTSNTKLFDKMNLNLNYQSLEESRHNRNFNSKNLSNRFEKVKTGGMNLGFIKSTKNHSIRYGIDILLNSLNSTAHKLDIVANTTSKLDTRYPDGKNNMNNLAIYLSDTWRASKKFTIVEGVRAGYSTLRSTLVDTALMFHLPYTEIKQNTPVYSGNLGLIHKPGDNSKISILLSTGYRVPNVDDLSKIFGSAPGKVIVPNPDLKPERTINYELGYSQTIGGQMKIEGSVYYTDFYNIAVVEEFKYRGSDSLLYDGTMSRVYANQNKDKAYIAGASGNLLVRLTKNISFDLSAIYTYGRIKTDSIDQPLDHIPPFSISSSLKFHPGKLKTELSFNYNSWKKLKDYYLNGEDNEQYATPVGMPAWYTFNFRISYPILNQLNLQLGVDNIFDIQYRTFASGINAPGRNFIFSVKSTF